jgi:hypothetical protein
MKQWKIATPIVVIALFVTWYAFRPERLVVNRRVCEALPTSQAASPAQALESGTFYGVLHPTEGAATIYRMGDGTRLQKLERPGRSRLYGGCGADGSASILAVPH